MQRYTGQENVVQICEALVAAKFTAILAQSFLDTPKLNDLWCYIDNKT